MRDTQKPDTIEEALHRYGTDLISHPASRGIHDIEEAGTIMLAARNSLLRLQAENEALRADAAKHQQEMTAWVAEGEAIMAHGGPMFKLGTWWADRPWRKL